MCKPSVAVNGGSAATDVAYQALVSAENMPELGDLAETLTAAYAAFVRMPKCHSTIARSEFGIP